MGLGFGFTRRDNGVDIGGSIARSTRGSLCSRVVRGGYGAKSCCTWWVHRDLVQYPSGTTLDRAVSTRYVTSSTEPCADDALLLRITGHPETRARSSAAPATYAAYLVGTPRSRAVLSGYGAKSRGTHRVRHKIAVYLAGTARKTWLLSEPRAVRPARLSEKEKK